jgi:hypothetical protein
MVRRVSATAVGRLLGRAHLYRIQPLSVVRLPLTEYHLLPAATHAVRPRLSRETWTRFGSVRSRVFRQRAVCIIQAFFYVPALLSFSFQSPLFPFFLGQLCLISNETYTGQYVPTTPGRNSEPQTLQTDPDHV